MDVRQVRIVDEKGTPQLVLTSDTRLADPPGAGRKVGGAALLFNNAAGKEVGGVGMHEKNNAFCLDYPPKPGTAHGGSEALCIVEEDGHVAGVYVNDPESGPNRTGAGNERLAFSVDHGESKIVLNGKDGKPRIRLAVDANDVPRIEFLDAKGNAVYTLPPKP
ncbi:hypothetical protein LZC95_17490 [Pendulispora brunnea]|uniref:Uncharacterized protein n=1 Tax=Pendulispora brunnea TaxID=2905690 RepID=A0ABZ2KIY2_9BACT